MNLSELVKFSNEYGANPEYVLAGGGNTSAKDEAELYIKGSGTMLATIKAEEFVGMDRSKLDAMMNANYPDNDAEREAAALKDMMAARLPGFEDKRPSVETTLHNLLPFTYVLHLHPALINGLTCGKDGEKTVEKLFPGEIVWIPLSRPGYVLSKLCEQKLDEYKKEHGKDAQIILLQNHGIFVAANTREELNQLMDHVVSTLKAQLKRKPDLSEVPYDKEKVEELKKELAALYSPDGKADFITNKEIARLVSSREAFKPVSAAFSPDHIVYCKAEFLFSETADDLAGQFADFKERFGYAPKVVCVQGLGAFILGDTEKEIATSKILFLDAVKVSVYAESFGGPLHMTQELIDFITNWEVEAYRQKVGKS